MYDCQFQSEARQIKLKILVASTREVQRPHSKYRRNEISTMCVFGNRLAPFAHLFDEHWRINSQTATGLVIQLLQHLVVCSLMASIFHDPIECAYKFNWTPHKTPSLYARNWMVVFLPPIAVSVSAPNAPKAEAKSKYPLTWYHKWNKFIWTFVWIANVEWVFFCWLHFSFSGGKFR